MTNSRPLETLTAEDFLDVTGSRFELTVELPEPGGHATFRLELAAVTRTGGGRPGGFRQPFALLFHGPIEPVLPQGIHRLEHDKLGVLELFIVPVGPNEPTAEGEQPTAMRYEAVFG